MHCPHCNWAVEGFKVRDVAFPACCYTPQHVEAN